MKNDLTITINQAFEVGGYFGVPLGSAIGGVISPADCGYIDGPVRNTEPPIDHFWRTYKQDWLRWEPLRPGVKRAITGLHSVTGDERYRGLGFVDEMP